MCILKHLKTPQPVSIIIEIIFWELICSLLKLLILKYVKSVLYCIYFPKFHMQECIQWM